MLKEKTTLVIKYCLKFIRKQLVYGMLIILTVLVVPAILIKALGNYQKHSNANETKEYLTHPLSSEQYAQISIVDACKIEGECLKGVALFTGRINKNNVDKFNAFIDTHPKLDTVCLNSTGGETKHALRMSKLISERELATCMADYYKFSSTKTILTGGSCASSCNMLLLASKTRIKQGVSLSFAGHSFASTGQARFSLFNYHWFVKDTLITEPTDFYDSLDIANTADKEKHIKYVSFVKGIPHTYGLKRLNNEELENFRIFTE